MLRNKKVLVLAGAAAMAVLVGASARVGGAAPAFRAPATPDQRDYAADVRAGRAHQLPPGPPGRDTVHMGVWEGCRFVILSAHKTSYETNDGALVDMVDPPEAMPPRSADCVDRDPTDAEIQAMRDQVNALNDPGRPSGMGNPSMPPQPATHSGRP